MSMLSSTVARVSAHMRANSGAARAFTTGAGVMGPKSTSGTGAALRGGGFDPRQWATKPKPRAPKSGPITPSSRRAFSTMRGASATNGAAASAPGGGIGVFQRTTSGNGYVEFLDSASATRMIQERSRANYINNAPVFVRPIINGGYFCMETLFSLPFPVLAGLCFMPIGLYYYGDGKRVEQGNVFTDVGTHRVPAGTMELLDKRQHSHMSVGNKSSPNQVTKEGLALMTDGTFACETARGKFVLEKFGLSDEILSKIKYFKSADGLGNMLNAKNIVAEDVIGSEKVVDADGVEKIVDITKERVKLFHQRIQQSKGIGGGPQGHNSPGVKPVSAYVCRATGHVFVNYLDGNRKDLLPKDDDGKPLYTEAELTVTDATTGEEVPAPLRYFKVYKNTVMAKKNLHSFLMDYQGRLIELGESDREHYEIFWDRLRRKNDPTTLASKTFGII